jgi:hypothetical protein
MPERMSLVGFFIGAIALSNPSFNIVAEEEGKIDLVNHSEDYKSNNFFGNPPNEEWNKTYGGDLFDNGYGVKQTSDGGYIIGSSKNETGYYQGGDCWLIKTDKFGNIEWDKTFGGTENDKGWTVQQTKDGGYAVIGTTSSFGSGICHDAYFIKTDINGNKLWEKTYGSEDTVDCGLSFKETADGGYLIIGSWNTGFFGDAWLIKTDSNGNMIWDRTFGGADLEYGYSVLQTNDLGFIFTCLTYSYGAGDCDAWLIKTDSDGNMIWNRTFGGEGFDDCYSLIASDDGGYTLVGATDSYDSNGDVWLVKTDDEGYEQWNKTYGGNEMDCGTFLHQTNDGGYIILGGTESFGAGDEDFYLIRTDSFGNIKWDKTFGGINYDKGWNVWQTMDGGYILSGLTYSYGAGESDVWLIKIEPEEDEIFNMVIKGGFRVSSDIENYGGTVAYDVPWSIDLNGGLILAGEHSEGVISELAPGATKTIRQTTLYGIGMTTITVTAGDATKQATAFILGPLVLGVEEIS